MPHFLPLITSSFFFDATGLTATRPAPTRRIDVFCADLHANRPVRPAEDRAANGLGVAIMLMVFKIGVFSEK